MKTFDQHLDTVATFTAELNLLVATIHKPQFKFQIINLNDQVAWKLIFTEHYQSKWICSSDLKVIMDLAKRHNMNLAIDFNQQCFDLYFNK
jgi:hypothetical protein